jgi:glycerol uptake facilitator-like aquaporin
MDCRREGGRVNIPADKSLHFFASAMIGILCGAAFTPITAFGLAMIPGAIRELYQRQGWEGWHDMVANILGAIVGILLIRMVV